jgi:hypothetical protein
MGSARRIDQLCRIRNLLPNASLEDISNTKITPDPAHVW